MEKGELENIFLEKTKIQNSYCRRTLNMKQQQEMFGRNQQ